MNRTVLVVDDVIRMAKSGVGDDQIIEFVRNSSAPFEITGDDVIAMNEAKVSPAVMKFVIDESAARMKAERNQAVPQQQQQYDNRGNDPQRVVVEHQYPVYAGPSYPSAYPYYYDPYYTYPSIPYYYGYPSVSIGFGLGYYGYYGYPYYGYYGHGHYYGGGGYHGGHGGGYHGGHGGHGGGGHPGNGGHGGHGGRGGGHH